MVFTEFFNIFLTSLVSAAALFILTKIMGNKQISQLNLFDYIVGITIGSIAAETAINLDEDFLYSLEAMIIYGALALIITVLSAKKPTARKILVGYPVILFDNGVFYRENMKRAKVDICDFLTLARSQGYFDLKDIKTAVIEYNGTVSFLPTAKYAPPSAEDLGLEPSQQELVANVIFDGEIMKDALKAVGKDEKWLAKNISAQGYKKADEIFLGTCDRDGNLALYPLSKEKRTVRILE